jgi:hypothetical protein
VESRSLPTEARQSLVGVLGSEDLLQVGELHGEPLFELLVGSIANELVGDPGRNRRLVANLARFLPIARAAFASTVLPVRTSHRVSGIPMRRDVRCVPPSPG